MYKESESASVHSMVTQSMIKDDFYSSHSQEECKAEWHRRYEALSPPKNDVSPIQAVSSPSGLQFEMVGPVLHVTEVQHSALNTKTSHWYYDVENWTQSSFGREGDELDRDMSDGSIEWVRKHYLPKVAEPDLPAPTI